MLQQTSILFTCLLSNYAIKISICCPPSQSPPAFGCWPAVKCSSKHCFFYFLTTFWVNVLPKSWLKYTTLASQKCAPSSPDLCQVFLWMSIKLLATKVRKSLYRVRSPFRMCSCQSTILVVMKNVKLLFCFALFCFV